MGKSIFAWQIIFLPEGLAAPAAGAHGDVSIFMKELKQRFSIQYNRTHGRFWTLWAERFRSVLIEGRPLALQTVAAYIDLNPVRAHLLQDPKEYRFCGYAEAHGGPDKARRDLP